MHATGLARKIAVSILSDSLLVRETIAAGLKFQDQIHVVANAGSLHQLLQRLDGRVVDVLLAHANIDGALGAELRWDARTLMPATHLIVLGFRRSAQDLVRWVEAGAMAYLEQDVSCRELLETIRDAARWRPGCSMSLLTRVIEPLGQMTYKAARLDGCRSAQPLSDRELEIALTLPAELRKRILDSGQNRGRRATALAAIILDTRT